MIVRQTVTRAWTARLCHAPRSSSGTKLRNMCLSASDRCRFDQRSNLSLVSAGRIYSHSFNRIVFTNTPNAKGNLCLCLCMCYGNAMFKMHSGKLDKDLTYCKGDIKQHFIYTHTYIHTHTRTYTGTHTRAHTHTCTRAHPHTRTRAHAHTHTHIHSGL